MNKYLKIHILKYPKMQIEDKIKLLMQANLGNGHLVTDYEVILNRVSKEYIETKLLNVEYDLIEKISDKYSRIYLKPYYEKHHSFSDLVEIFIESSTKKTSKHKFLKELKKLKHNINNEEIIFLNKYLEEKNFLISHSDIYKNEYHPHYLVIHNKFIERI